MHHSYMNPFSIQLSLSSVRLVSIRRCEDCILEYNLHCSVHPLTPIFPTCQPTQSVKVERPNGEGDDGIYIYIYILHTHMHHSYMNPGQRTSTIYPAYASLL